MISFDKFRPIEFVVGHGKLLDEDSAGQSRHQNQKV